MVVGVDFNDVDSVVAVEITSTSVVFLSSVFCVVMVLFLFI